MHPFWEASLWRMTQCHAIYLVIFAVSTCKANGHAGFEGLDTTPHAKPMGMRVARDWTLHYNTTFVYFQMHLTNCDDYQITQSQH
jgi:hypothetical protein